MSWADGISRARQLTGEGDRYVVAVVGDGALTGGMAWEAVNNIAADRDRRVVIVVNDNGRSYAPTIGGLADQLAALRRTTWASIWRASSATRSRPATTAPSCSPATSGSTATPW